MLPLHAGGLIALLDEAGLIDDADALRMGVPPGHMLLELIAHARFVPAIQAQKLLQIPRRRAGGIGHRLDALARQIAQLTLDIQVQMPPGRDPAKAVIKLVQKTVNSGLIRKIVLASMPMTSIEVPFLWDHRVAA